MFQNKTKKKKIYDAFLRPKKGGERVVHKYFTFS